MVSTGRPHILEGPNWFKNLLDVKQPFLLSYNLAAMTGASKITFPKALASASINTKYRGVSGKMALRISPSLVGGHPRVELVALGVSVLSFKLPVGPVDKTFDTLKLRLLLPDEEAYPSATLDTATGDITPLNLTLALDARGLLSILGSHDGKVRIDLTFQERLNLADGSLQGTGQGTIKDGVLSGTFMAFAHAKPPADIVCNVASLECVSPGAACRVNGTNGTCVQVSGGCACRDAAGNNLRVYR
jgi:hypothetical protein